MTLRCPGEPALLVLGGRLAVGAALRDGGLSNDGPPALMATWSQAVVGG